MNQPNYTGRRFICLVRCSTDEQTGTSIPDQVNLLHSYGKDQGMIHAGRDMIVDGVTGSIPGARTDIEQIIARKNERNDFDILLVQDLSRLTRSGVEHGSKIEYDLVAAGITVIFASSNLPQGDHAGIVKSVEYYSAQQYAKSVSYSTARGQMSAILDGRINYCQRLPFAVDRLYVAFDGRELHIIRNCSDGSQLKLDPKTQAVLDTCPKGSGYRKQKGETSVLIPGADEKTKIVRQIFRRRLIEGWGSHRIAKELNDAGVHGPTVRVWHAASVQTILQNPIYTGIGYANRKSDAVYNRRSPNAPTAAKVDRQELIVRKRPKMRYRARAEWIEQKHEKLDNFLGDDLKPMVIEFQKKYLLGKARVVEPRRDRHTQSSFILKGLLRSKQDGWPMTGIIKGRGFRYYCLSRAYPTSDKTMRRLVQADALEQAVLAAAREVLGQKTELAKQIEETVRRQHQLADRDRHDLNDLLAERDKIRGQLEFIIDSLGACSRDIAGQKAAQLERQLQTIQDRIAKASEGAESESIDKLVERAVKQAGNMLAVLDQTPGPAVRSALAGLVMKLEVDLETLEVKMELALPSWATLAANRHQGAVGLTTTSSPGTGHETHSEIPLILAVFDCEHTEQNCYDCRRKAA